MFCFRCCSSMRWEFNSEQLPQFSKPSDTDRLLLLPQWQRETSILLVISRKTTPRLQNTLLQGEAWSQARTDPIWLLLSYNASREIQYQLQARMRKLCISLLSDISETIPQVSNSHQKEWAIKNKKEKTKRQKEKSTYSYPCLILECHYHEQNSLHSNVLVQVTLPI